MTLCACVLCISTILVAADLDKNHYFESNELGFDTSVLQTGETLECLAKRGFTRAVFRIHRTDGSVDVRGLTNVMLTWKVLGNKSDVSIYPNPQSNETGAQQARKSIAFLGNAKDYVNMIWLRILITNWSTDRSYNQRFIQSMIQGMKASGWTRWGIHSNRYNWQTIVGLEYGLTKDGINPPLWYPHWDDEHNMDDWNKTMAFGGWTQPVMKTYKGSVRLCKTDINLNYYVEHNHIATTSVYPFFILEKKDKNIYQPESHFKFKEAHIIGLLCGAFILVVPMLVMCLLIMRREAKTTSDQLHELYERLTRCSSLDSEIPVNQQTENLPYDKAFEIDINSIEFGELLGQGQFGKVMAGQLISQNDKTKEVAIKMPRNGNDPGHQRALLDELKLMIHLGHHQNVLSLIGAVTKSMVNAQLYIVVEYCKWGSLLEYITDRKHCFQNQILTYAPPNQPLDYAEALIGANQDQSLCTSDLLSFCHQTALGMTFLAERTVTARNLLLTEAKIVKVADFGLAKQQPVYQLHRTNVPLPIRWMALESIVDKEFTVKSDVWSFAVVMWELFSLGRTPYDTVEDTVRVTEFLKVGNRLEQPLFSPPEMYELMKQCWLADPQQRPSFEACREIIGAFLQEHFPQKYAHLCATLENGQKKYGNMRMVAAAVNPNRHAVGSNNVTKNGQLSLIRF